VDLFCYQTSAGSRPFVDWLEGLHDRRARATIQARLARAAGGNLGDVVPVGAGVIEMRIDWDRDTASTSRGWAKSWFCSFAAETSGRNQRTSRMPKRISKISRPVRRKRSAAPSLPYEPWLIERLKSPVEAAAYLEAVLADGDQAAIMLALRHVAQSQGGVAQIARKAKLTREATYKMLSKSGNPELRSLSAVLKATGLRIAVKPLADRTTR
jgi:probable addiction module antidote protein